MLLNELHQKKQQIESLTKQYGGLNIRVFGSVARGEESSHSDIDFLVQFPQGYDVFKQRMPLENGLQELCNHPVDLIPEHELSPYLREHILAEAVEL